MDSWRRTRTIGRAAAACWIVSTISARAQAQSTYNIEELTDFGTGLATCVQNNLNTVTASLRGAMDADAWTGPRYLNADVFEQDFFDTSIDPDGLDHLYADSARVSVYAGHGSPGTVYFPGHGGLGCTASTNDSMRLALSSADGGGVATLAVWLACQVLNVDPVGSSQMINQVRQQLGWTNNVSIGDDEPRDVYEATRTQPNKDAWLALMGGPGGENPVTFAVEDRRPLVVTMTDVNSAEDCWAHHDRQAWGQSALDPLNGPVSYVCWEELE